MHIASFCFGSTMGFCTYVPKLFPTELRLRGAGVSSVAGRAASILAPQAVTVRYAYDGVNAVVYPLVAMLIAQGIVVAVFGIQTNRRTPTPSTGATDNARFCYRSMRMNDTETIPLKADGTSLHRQIFLVLRDQIARGDRAPGSILPKEEALCEQFGVSRVTVRRALADLEAQGYVQRRHGRGTFVRDDVLAPPPAMSPTLMESLKQLGRETQVQVLRVRTEVPPLPIASFLQRDGDAKALHATRLRSASDTPLMLTEAWIPEHLGSRITKVELRKRPLYQILLDQGVKFGHVIQEITAEAADPWRASVLKTTVGAPLIRMTRLMYDPEDRPRPAPHGVHGAGAQPHLDGHLERPDRHAERGSHRA